MPTKKTQVSRKSAMTACGTHLKPGYSFGRGKDKGKTFKTVKVAAKKKSTATAKKKTTSKKK